MSVQHCKFPRQSASPSKHWLSFKVQQGCPPRHGLPQARLGLKQLSRSPTCLCSCLFLHFRPSSQSFVQQECPPRHGPHARLGSKQQSSVESKPNLPLQLSCPHLRPSSQLELLHITVALALFKRIFSATTTVPSITGVPAALQCSNHLWSQTQIHDDSCPFHRSNLVHSPCLRHNHPHHFHIVGRAGFDNKSCRHCSALWS